MSKKILFKDKNPYGWEVYPRPFPANSALPQWWKDEPSYFVTPRNPSGKKLIVGNGGSNATFRHCTPMRDALAGGYIIPLFSDVQVEQTANGPTISWRVKHSPVFQPHGSTSANVEPPAGYDPVVFKYINTWIPKTPPGYSLLVVSPFGYRNLPFHAVPAILDSDKMTQELVPPMWIKTGFEGLVEKGTPMIQVIPFKRDNWEAEFDYYQNNEYDYIEERSFNANIVSHYLKNVWSKKEFK